MSAFIVYTQSNIKDIHDLPQAIFVKEHTSITAFLFTILWTLYHRLWRTSLLLGILYSLLSTANHYSYISDAQSILLCLIIMLYCAFSACDWLQTSLQAKGYKQNTVIMAKDMLSAQQRFYDNFKV